MKNPIETWFDNEISKIKTQFVDAGDELAAKEIERLAPLGKTLIDYLFLQLNGLSTQTSITTQPVKRAQPVNDLPEGFRG